MSHRTDWRVLTTQDPIPGNAPEIKDAASNYDRIRQAIADAQEALATVLSRNFTEAMLSASVDKIKDSARTIRNGLGDVAARYEIAAVALEEYAGELADAQTAADEAEEEAQQAQTVLDEAKENKRNAEKRRVSAQSAVTKYQDDPSSETASDLKKARQNRSNAQNDIWDAEADILAAQTRISNAQIKLNQAITKRDDAARTAAREIRNQINNDGLNDTWWDDWGSKIAGLLLFIAQGIGDAIVNAVKGLVEATGLADFIKAIATLAEALHALSQGDWDTFKEKLAKGIEQYLEGVSKFASVVSTICGIVALILVFIPGCQGAAGILYGISLLADLAYIAAEGTLALKEGMRDGDWSRMQNLGIDTAIIGAVTLLGPIGKGIKSVVPRPILKEGVSAIRGIGQNMKRTGDDIGQFLKSTGDEWWSTAKNPKSWFKPAEPGPVNIAEFVIQEAKPFIEYMNDHPLPPLLSLPLPPRMHTLPTLDIDIHFSVDIDISVDISSPHR